MEPCGKVSASTIYTLVFADFNKEDLLVDFSHAKSHLKKCSVCHEHIKELSDRIHSDLKFMRQLIDLGLTKEEIYEELFYDTPSPDLYLICITDAIEKMKVKYTLPYYKRFISNQEAIEITGCEEKSTGIQTAHDIEYYKREFGI